MGTDPVQGLCPFYLIPFVILQLNEYVSVSVKATFELFHVMIIRKGAFLDHFRSDYDKYN